jgi:hypothetical protein
MASATPPRPDSVNNTATRTVLSAARLFTHEDGSRVPDLLPENGDALSTAVAELEAVAADYADLALRHGHGLSLRERAFALMVFTRTAVDIIATSLRWAAIACDDDRAPHAADYAALLGALTHQLVTTSGRPQIWLWEAARSCAMTVAEDVVQERGTWRDSAALQARMDAADAATRPTATG